MQTGLSSHAMRHCKLKPGYFDFTHAKRHQTQKKYVCTLARVSPVVLTSAVLASTYGFSFSSVLDTSLIKSRTHYQPSMLCPPSCFPTIKGEIQTENYPYPRIPLASFPRIEGSQQCYSTGCGGVVVAAAVVAVTAAAAAVVTAVTAADDVITTVAAVVVVADPSGNASAATSDGAAPADDSRAPTAPLSGVAEVTVPLVVAVTFDTASDDAAPADDSRAPTASLSGVAEGTVPLAVDAAFDAAVSSAGAGALAALLPM